MDPVSNANRIALLLRRRLEERARTSASGKGARGEGAAGAAARSPLQGAAALGALDDRRLKRALIENILADQFGSALLNDARFQQLVDQVSDAIDSDGDGNLLLARAVADLRAGSKPG